MKTQIIILGTLHSLQCGTSDHSCENINQFKLQILDICNRYNIKYIAEEMCEEGLAAYNSDATIASDIAKFLHEVQHNYIDLPLKQKILLKIDNASLAHFAAKRFKANDSAKTYKKLSDIVSGSVRECCWFANLLDTDIWPALLICGDDHVEKMRILIQKIDRRAFVAAYRLVDYHRTQ